MTARPPPAGVLRSLLTSSLTSLTRWPGRPALPLSSARCAKAASQAALFGEKADGGGSSCSFDFWEPARAFQSEKKPQPPAGAPILPQAGCLSSSEVGVGSARDPGLGPASFLNSKEKKRKAEKCGWSGGSRVPGKPGRAGEHSPRKGAASSGACGPLPCTHGWRVQEGGASAHG